MSAANDDRFRGARIKLEPQAPAPKEEPTLAPGGIVKGPGPIPVEPADLGFTKKADDGTEVRLERDEDGGLQIVLEREGHTIRTIRIGRAIVLDLIGIDAPHELARAAEAIVAKYDDDQHGDIRGIDEQIENLRKALR